MNPFRAVQISAFSLVANVRRGEASGDPDYMYRQIYRWYSKTFNTPLHEVYALPEYDILQAYWESNYENMDDQCLEEARLDLIMTEAEREKEALLKNMDDVDMFEMVREEEETPVDRLVSETDKFKGALDRFKKTMSKEGKEASLESEGPTPKVPPNIVMKFEDSSTWDLEADSIGMLNDPKSK